MIYLDTSLRYLHSYSFFFNLGCTDGLTQSERIYEWEYKALTNVTHLPRSGWLNSLNQTQIDAFM